MKKIIACLLTLSLFLLSLFGCTATDDAVSSKPKEIIIFAAASMTETLTEIAEIYETANPDVKLIFNFDSSGTLKTQIEEGAECDIFISASQKPMNQLDITADPAINTDGLDFILSDTRRDILENKVALVVPKDNQNYINSFDDMASRLKDGDILMAIGNSDVPVGEYTLSIFDYFGLATEALDQNACLTYGSNVKEVTTQVREGVVDCGIVYQTDAYSANLEIVDTASSEMCGQVIYPAAVIKGSENVELATDFLDYLKSEQACDIFIRVGFTPII